MMMKIYLIYLFVFFNSVFTTSSQSLFDIFELKSLEILNDFNEKDKKKYQGILNNRNKELLQNRIDNLSFDYLFIEEHYYSFNHKDYVDIKYLTSERYFNKTDSIPFLMVENESVVDIEIEYGETFLMYELENTNKKKLKPLLTKYSELKNIQRYNYEKKRYTFWLPRKNKGNSWYKRIEKKRLKGDYIILTMIDKVNNKVIVSFQKPPKNPKFDLRTVSFERIL